jgi:hypothetical protein
MLYVASFSDWTKAVFPLCYPNTPGFISAFGILRLRYPESVAVPNLGMDLKVYTGGVGSVSLYARYDLVNAIVSSTPITSATSPFEVGFSSKNSINADDYVFSGPTTSTIQVFFEVG